MRPFAELLDALVFTPSRLGKLRLMHRYFEVTPDPDRGWALAALTGGLSFREAKPALIRGLVGERVDPVLFEWSYDFVGDLAETVSLIWPERPRACPRAGLRPDPGGGPEPRLTEIVARLHAAGRGEVPRLLAGWLDALDATGRWALLKLITGGLRVGVSARLAKTAVAELGPVDVAEVEEVWHALAAPYAPLFAWLAGGAPRPEPGAAPSFRPLMLANPIEDGDLATLDPAAYRAEWKWDGIRVQLVARHGHRCLYSRTGDDISGAFPEIGEAMDFDAVLDGELLVGRQVDSAALFEVRYQVAPFNDLQQRLNRKTVTAKTRAEFPAFVRLYDMLFDGDDDVRPLPFDARRSRLEAWFRAAPRRRLDVSPLLAFATWDELAERRQGARQNAIEGVMLKRADSAYVAGRPKGPWFKWKRGPLTVDCVLMYAQRGHGKRSSYYSDYTFGCWREGELVPVGKAYFGFTDAELGELDKWVRNHTVNRFGPVREVAPGLVFEVAFDSVHRSGRHRSGLAMRFPRINRIRWDKPAEEADRLATLERLLA
ncbi:MAG: cisplatin damage response ATP-dependent DNA ligase [Proteobacteria bacterium]|nr:cisplatin damage response ATP-dependent DNA ligase [Pseudomonadota bacterium]